MILKIAIMGFKRTLLIVMFIRCSTLLQAQEPITKDKQELQQTVVSMFEALSIRDSVALRAHCTSDITLFEYGEIWSIDTLINRAITMNTAADFNRVNTFEFISTESEKDRAWLTYRLTSIVTRDGKKSTVQWLETVVLARQKKKWKVKHLHSTLIKRD